MKTAAKKISLGFLAAYFLLISALPASANCIWALNENCADIGASNNWTQKDDGNCIQALKDRYYGASRKCCCAADGVNGCCYLVNKDGSTKASNTSGEDCQKMEATLNRDDYQRLSFHQDYAAVNDSCVSKNYLNCSWKKKTYVNFTNNNQKENILGGCSDQEKLSSDGSCSAVKKPEDENNLSGQITYVCCCDESGSQTSIVADNTKKPKFAFPELSVKIPNLNLTPTGSLVTAIDADGNMNISIPWIGEYIQAVYKYLFSIVGIVAALTIMAAGFLWMLSAGDNSKITRARQLISGSLLGIVLLFCSYMILYWINPDLIKLPSISMGVVDTEYLEDADVMVVGGSEDNPYQAGCLAAKKDDYSVCEKYGSSQPANLTTLEGKLVESSIVTKYLAAMECVKEKNGSYLFYINESWRSAAKQLEYKYKLGDRAATPCCSNHGSGKALDLKRKDGQAMSWDYNQISSLKDCMNKQGLYAKLSTEPWHWSLSGR